MGRVSVSVAGQTATIDYAVGNTAPAGFKSIVDFIPAGGGWRDALPFLTGNVWLPEGTYEFDANWTKATANLAARLILLELPKAVTRVRLHPKTVLFMRPGTSKSWSYAETVAGVTTPLSTLQQTGGQIVELTGGQLVMTDQGHNYHGWSIFNPKATDGEVSIDTFGGAGTGGANPYETFTGTVHGGIRWLVQGITDGMDLDGKTNRSAVGITFQDSLDTVIGPKAIVRNFRASTAVFYRSIRCGINGATLGRTGQVLAAFGSGCYLNLELTNGTWIKDAKGYGLAKDTDVSVSMAGDKGGITIGGVYYSFDDASLLVEDSPTLGVNWTGTKNGLIGTRMWAQDVTLPDPRRMGPLFAPGGRYASMGLTVDNVDAKGYPFLVGKHQGYDTRPAGVRTTPTVKVGGQVVPSWTSAYGKTMVGPGGQPIPAAA